MKKENILRRIYLLTFTFMTMLMGANAAVVPYAEYTEGNQTLTFKYGEMPNSDNVWDVSNTDSLMKIGWKSHTLVTVVFTESFAQARPKACTGWFSGHNKLTTITGIKNLNTQEVRSMKLMFKGCESLSSLDVSGFKTSKVIDMSEMFEDCKSLTSLNTSNFNTSKVLDMLAMFYGCEKLTTLDVSHFNTSNVTNMRYMFAGCSSLTTLDVSGFNTSKVTDMYSMFSNCKSLTNLDISDFKTEKVKTMEYMFNYCEKLTTLDVSHFNTSNVTNMSYMFHMCENITNLDVSGFNTSKVTDMYSMFSNCRKLTNLDVSNFNTSNVTKIGYMFYGCEKVQNLDLSNFNTSKVEDMRFMFRECSSLQKLDISSFNTLKVIYMNNMFDKCTSLTSIDLSSFYTPHLRYMGYMFAECKSLTTIDVSTFYTQICEDMQYMFYECSNLQTIYCNDTWKCEESFNMFAKCYVLKGKKSYNESYLDARDANPETGLFTKKNFHYLWLAGEQVTDDNCADLSVLNGVSGNVSYDPENKILYLNNSSISTIDQGKYGILSKEDKLTIHLTGSNSVTSGWESGIASTSTELNFTGGGSLMVTGIDILKCYENNTVNISGNVDIESINITGTHIDDNYYTTLTVSGRDTHLKLKSNSGAVTCLKDMKLNDNLFILSPSGARFDKTVHGICIGDSLVKNEYVEIKKPDTYILMIADQVVNSLNCNNLSVIPGVEGTVKYDAATNTLTLKDATITNTSTNGNDNKGYGILSNMDGMTIHLEGENTITSTQWDGLASIGSLTITGNGTLNINAKGTSLDMIGGTSYYLNITDSAKVFAKGMYGIYGGIKTVPVAGGQLTESYVTHLCVSGEKTELHVFGTEQCAKIIAFLEMDDNMEMRGESGKAYFEQNSFCYYERRRYQPYVNQWVTIRYASVHGDVNRDRSITMADANMVVNYFLSTDKPEDFDLRAADVNGDGEITMADANQIVNMFLNGEQTEPVQ